MEIDSQENALHFMFLLTYSIFFMIPLSFTKKSNLLGSDSSEIHFFF